MGSIEVLKTTAVWEILFRSLVEIEENFLKNLLPYIRDRTVNLKAKVTFRVTAVRTMNLSVRIFSLTYKNKYHKCRVYKVKKGKVLPVLN
jgi:hypothetical protein